MKHLIKTALFLLALIIPATALAHDFEVNGIYYNITGTTATVTSSPSSNQYSGSVTIPSTVTYGGTNYPVTAIGEGAFAGCTSLTRINIPSSVTEIGSSAFDSCINLTNITIPNSVTAISDYMFLCCERLANVNIPNSVTTIGEGAFSGCIGMTNINISNSVTSIGSLAFADCTSLARINVPNSVTVIGESAFINCSSLANINIPNSVTSIAWSTFQGCSSLTSIRIPNSVTTIGVYSFYLCSNLTSVDIPNSVTSIGAMAFSACSSLTSVNIPNSVTYIGYEAFSCCTSLATVNIGNSVTMIEDGAFMCSFNDIYCFSTTPPVCSDYTFEKYSATLHVPAASLAAYFTAPEWSKFENIVGDAIETTGISISSDSLEIQSGEQIELTATVTPANASCKDVAWHSTDTNVATVEDGVVTAVGIGECDIYAYCMGMPAICHVSVSNRISLEQQEAMLLPNHMLVLNPTAPAMPEGFTVTSSDPTVAAARVMNGKVQIVGIKEGTTTITVASSDGTAQPATCLVTVYTESGDANCDGFVNVNDVTDLIDYLLGSETTSFKEGNVDLNGDGKINVADVAALIDQLLTTSE